MLYLILLKSYLTCKHIICISCCPEISRTVAPATAQEQGPVVAHANGVDGKEYFLRDRGRWFIDDFEKRFEQQQFLTYNHPAGMSA